MPYRVIYKFENGRIVEVEGKEPYPPVKVRKVFEDDDCGWKTIVSFRLSKTKSAKLSGQLEYVVYEEIL